jgi:tRNA wybutosine-synthesizing protein 3
MQIEHDMVGLYESVSKFEQEKKRILDKADYSKIGSIDHGIRRIVELINSKPDYCTTSSCAGRVTLLERKSDRKDQSSWLLSSHTSVSSMELKDNLKSDHDVWLMQESFILHVFCRDIDSASKFLAVCKDMGLKHAGIVSTSKKLMVEAIGNEKIETLMMKEGRLLVDDAYIEIIVKECNDRMERNRKKLDILYTQLKQI